MKINAKYLFKHKFGENAVKINSPNYHAGLLLSHASNISFFVQYKATARTLAVVQYKATTRTLAVVQYKATARTLAVVQYKATARTLAVVQYNNC